MKDLAKNLLDNLNRRFKSIEENKVFAEATFLDPRFKRHCFTNEELFNRAKQSLIVQITTMVQNRTDFKEKIESDKDMTNNIQPEQKPKNHWSDFDEKVSYFIQNPKPKIAVIVEVDKYLEEPLQPRADNPLQWWIERRYTYPRRYLRREYSRKQVI